MSSCFKTIAKIFLNIQNATKKFTKDKGKCTHLIYGSSIFISIAIEAMSTDKLIITYQNDFLIIKKEDEEAVVAYSAT